MSKVSGGGNEGSIAFRGQSISLLEWRAEVSVFGWLLTCTFDASQYAQPRIGAPYECRLVTPDGHRFVGKARLIKGNVTKAGNTWLAMLIGIGTLTEAPMSG